MKRIDFRPPFTNIYAGLQHTTTLLNCKNSVMPPDIIVVFSQQILFKNLLGENFYVCLIYVKYRFSYRMQDF